MLPHTSFAAVRSLSLGSSGSDVTALQKELIMAGYLSGNATGYYGALTQAAVQKFQCAQKIICTAFSNGKKHDFKLFKESKVYFKETTEAITDTGYLGLSKIHTKTTMSKKKSKKIIPATCKSAQRLAVVPAPKSAWLLT